MTLSAYSVLAEMLPDLADSIKTNEIMAPHTTFRVGGPADLYFQPNNPDDLLQVLDACRIIDLPVTVLGCGSNVLIPDEGLRHMVIQFGGTMQNIRIIGRDDVYKIIGDHPLDESMRVRLEDDSVFVLAETGALLADLSAFATAHNLNGMEFACGIPGSVGGAVYMNAGAYGFSMEDVIIATRYIDQDLSLRLACGEEHDYAYRHSLFSDKGSLVLASIFQLKRGEGEQIRSMVADFTKRRETTQPLEFPSAGSVFKRPTGYYAGKLISDAGLRGCRIGGAEVSQKHAGFIVNTGDATAEEIRTLIHHVQKIVFEKFGVELETEIRLIG